MTIDVTVPTARSLVREAGALYAGRPAAVRLRQRYRPFICPFDLVMAHIPAGARVLDAGCGSGLLLGLLAVLGRRISGIGFELSDVAVREAGAMAERVAASGSELHFHSRDVTGPWPDAEVDVVCLIDVMHHLPLTARASVLAQACAAVEPGGMLVYKDMSCRPRWRRLANQLHDLVIAREWVQHVEVADVESIVSANGLELIHAAGVHRLWYAHDLRVFRRPAA